MKVFVTGASGWIGMAVVPELIGAGHEVVGLARTDTGAEALSAGGAQVVRADLDDLAALGVAASESDGVIHLAFKHDLVYSGQFDAAAEADRRTIETLGEALAGTDRPLVIASGVATLPRGAVGTEQDRPEVGPGLHVRVLSERMTLDLAGRGVRSCSVRLAPTVHGDGDNGFIGIVVGVAREKGVSGYIGDGSNRWPAVHRADAASLFRLAVEGAPAGSVLHGVAEEGVAFRDIATVIGKHLDVPVESIEPAAAMDHFGWLSAVIGADIAASNVITRELLGWQPTHPGLLADLDEGHYFTTSA